MGIRNLKHTLQLIHNCGIFIKQPTPFQTANILTGSQKQAYYKTFESSLLSLNHL